MEEVRIDTRCFDDAMVKDMNRTAELCFKLNHTMPATEDYQGSKLSEYQGRK